MLKLSFDFTFSLHVVTLLLWYINRLLCWNISSPHRHTATL